MQNRSGNRRLLFAIFAIISELALLGAAFAAGAVFSAPVALKASAVAERAGFIRGTDGQETAPSIAPSTGETVIGRANIDLLAEAWNLVEQRFIRRSTIDTKKMTYGAIKGMLESLGDAGHTVFLSPDDLKAAEQAQSGLQQGIGILGVGIRNRVPRVLALTAESPARKAGLRPGDEIVSINGKRVQGQTAEQIVDQTRGPAGTSVTVGVIHYGEAAITDIPILRSAVTLPMVTWAMVPGTTVAHVLVSQFGERAKDELVTALKDAQSHGATGIVLDLRNDPGGLVSQEIAVASQFLRDGDALLERDAQGKLTKFPVQPGGAALDTPLAILVNESTLSSAEMVAAALQDRGRGPVLGVPTAGRGTVVAQFKLSDGSAIRLGIKEWLTPAGREVWHKGIAPDIAVMEPNGVVPVIPSEEAEMTPAQFQAANDLQLQRAVEQLSGGNSR